MFIWGRWNIDAPDVEMVASTANESRAAKNSKVDEKAAIEGLFVGMLITIIYT